MKFDNRWFFANKIGAKVWYGALLNPSLHQIIPDASVYMLSCLLICLYLCNSVKCFWFFFIQYSSVFFISSLERTWVSLIVGSFALFSMFLTNTHDVILYNFWTSLYFSIHKTFPIEHCSWAGILKLTMGICLSQSNSICCFSVNLMAGDSHCSLHNFKKSGPDRH